jgi:WD40 repeat protein
MFHASQTTSWVCAVRLGATLCLIGTAGPLVGLSQDAYTLELRATLLGHNGGFCKVRFASTSNVLVSSGSDGATRVWDAEQRSVVRALEIPGVHALGRDTRGPRDVIDFAISPDGGTVIESSREGHTDYKLRRWDWRTGAQTVIWATDRMGERPRVQYSPRGDLVALTASSGGSRVLLLRPTDGQVVDTLPNVGALAFSPDGTILACVAGTEVQLWDVAQRKELRRLKWDKEKVTQAVFSGDGTLLVTNGWDRTLCVWEVSSGQLLREIDAPDHWLIALRRDGQVVATGGTDGIIRLYSVADGRLLAKQRVEGGYVMSVAFSPTGETLASGGEDGHIRLWAVKSREPPRDGK